MYKDKILGGLYGQALGDAFGMPAYFDPDVTKKKIGWINDLISAADDHDVHSGLPKGRITDDSEQAFSIITEYLYSNEVTALDTANAIIKWYDRIGGDSSPYVGPSTKRGVNALKNGIDINKAGLMGDTNGAAMRVSVIGLLHPNDPIRAINDAHLSCIPTHNTNVAISGASAVASAISIAMNKDATIESVISAGIMGAELGRKKGPKWLGPSVSKRIKMAVDIANSSHNLDKTLIEIYERIGTSLSIVDAVASAFGMFALAKGDVKNTAIYSANLSGDADTVGAIACAISGTYEGFKAFDKELVNTLNNDIIFKSYNVLEIANGIEKWIKNK